MVSNKGKTDFELLIEKTQGFQNVLILLFF
jgi:hypothetical protein